IRSLVPPQNRIASRRAAGSRTAQVHTPSLALRSQGWRSLAPPRLQDPSGPIEQRASMDLHTVNRVRRPTHADEIASWEPGSAWLAGGTCVFSEPQVGVDTLIDLESLGWPALRPSADGLEISATCKVAQLDQLVESAPPRWAAAPLLRQCCRSFLASFK